VHLGILMVVRRYLTHAPTWQQALASLVLIGVGVTPATFGTVAGVALATFGVVLRWQTPRKRRLDRHSDDVGHGYLSG
jgi:Flp pilus assembly protein TadB